MFIISTYFKITFIIFFALFLPKVLFSQLELQEYMWNTNGSVRDIAEDTVNNTLYLGGKFNYVGKTIPYGVKIDSTLNVPESNFPNPNDEVYEAVSDDNGGWYIVGEFTMVGDSVRNRLAHIDNFGQVTSWNPNANDQVYAIAKSGDTIYVGGNFSSISNQTREYLASIDGVTGDLLAWSPSVNSSVWSIETYENTIFVGGSFTAFDIYGNVTSPNISTNGIVFKLKVYNDTLFLGGNFSTVDGQFINSLAAIDLNTNSLTPLNYSLTGISTTIFDFTRLNNSLYICGIFDAVGGLNRDNIAKINLYSGVDSLWESNANNVVYSITSSNNRVYAGGDFTLVGNQERSRVVALDTLYGDVLNWNPGLGSKANDITLFDSYVYLWGDFTCVNGVERNYLAAIDLSTGEPTSWNPSANNPNVNAIALNDSIIYVGGESTSFIGTNGQSQPDLAAINLVTGELSSWFPDVQGDIFSLLAVDSLLYVGGKFSKINGIDRFDLASFNLYDKSLTSWDPQVATSSGGYASVIHTIKKINNLLYVGGNFSSVNGYARGNLASFDIPSHNLRSWSPGVYNSINPRVHNIEVSDSSVYVGGNFSNINGYSRSYFGEIHSINNVVSSWSPNPNEKVYAISKNENKIYIGGDFSSFNNQPRNNFVEVYLDSNNLSNWTAGVKGRVRKIKASKNKLFIGGEINRVNNKGRKGFAVFIDTCGYPEISNVSSSDNNICANTSVTLEVNSGDLNDATHWEWYTGSCGGTAIGTGSSITVNPLNTTTYFVRGMGGCGEPTDCNQIEIDVVNTNEPSGSSSQTFCIDENNTINDLSVNGSNIQWYSSSSGGTLLAGSTPLVDGETYYATQTLNGCESVDRLAVTVNISSVNTNVTQQDITLNATQQNASYQWLNCADYSHMPGAVSQNFTPTSNGEYAVEVTYNTCIDTSDCFSIESVSTDALELEESLDVFPNPAHEKLNIVSSKTQIKAYELSDMQGKSIQKSIVNKNSTELLLANYESGIYYLKIFLDNNSVINKKVVKY
ncbi:MAG: T9SS type A sorting domain-containing protein [Brumimicrobium sp.]